MIVMPEYVQDIINDENLAWNKSVEKNTEKFLIKLSKASIEELERNISNKDFSNSKSPILKNEIHGLKNKFLNKGIGFFIIDGKVFATFSKEEMRHIYEIISKCLGSLYVQNIHKEKFVEIKDSGKTMAKGGRYHQTKEGGSYHTDSPQWEDVPDYIGLFCVRPAKEGGVSKFVSTYTIHNEILKKDERYLKCLYEKFYFDKRGEYEKGESPTVNEPVFKIVEGELRCRYLRNYIDEGHLIENSPLTKEQISALDVFDRFSKKEENIVDYDLKINDMLFFNNHRILHGRSSFEDFEDEELKRLMIRAWIKDEEV